ncbi:MAG TPA: hypothetical protein VNA24_14405 [Hyalangium sp.]|nr:hypothetical protein [Hyalangium sp.]
MSLGFQLPTPSLDIKAFDVNGNVFNVLDDKGGCWEWWWGWAPPSELCRRKNLASRTTDPGWAPRQETPLFSSTFHRSMLQKGRQVLQALTSLPVLKGSDARVTDRRSLASVVARVRLVWGHLHPQLFIRTMRPPRRG